MRRKRIENSNYEDLILIDWRNFLFKHIYGFDKKLKKLSGYTDSEHSIEGNEINFIKGIVDKLMDIKSKFKKSKMVVCYDAPRKETWRRRIYPKYKGNRGKNESDIDYPMYFGLIDKKIDEINILLDMKDDVTICYIDKMEADDLIYFYTEKYHKQFDGIHILSNDGDLSQLEKFGNVHRYEKIVPNIKKLKSMDWKYYMMEKVITGDSGDNIINIGSSWILNPALVSFAITETFEKKNKLVTEEEMIKKLYEIEKEDIHRFNKIVYAFKKTKSRDNKAYKKKNRVQFKKGSMDTFLHKKTDLSEYLKNEYDEQVSKNYKFNNKLVTFEQIPKFLVKKCKPHIKFETNIKLKDNFRRMVRLTYDVI